MDEKLRFLPSEFRHCLFSALSSERERSMHKLSRMKRQWETEELVEHWTLDVEDQGFLVYPKSRKSEPFLARIGKVQKHSYESEKWRR